MIVISSICVITRMEKSSKLIMQIIMGRDMAKSNLKLKPAEKKNNLKVVTKPDIKTTKYSDINLNKWKDYGHVKTDTLWEFPARLKEGGHSNEYHGNYIPQIAQQVYERFTKENDIVLDLFFGSGTSGIEAINMKRRCIGVELKDELAEKVSEKFTPKQLVTDVNIICADSASELAKEKVQARLDIMGRKQAQFLMLHPPMMILLSFLIKKKIYQIVLRQKNFMICLRKLQKTGMTFWKKADLLV